MSEPEISIVVPTRNGLAYLRHTIESVLSQDAENFELVVSDNHSEDGTAAYLASISDPRFRRIRPDQPLSMVAHFEFAIAAARGVWVTTLGDDDGLMPFFFTHLRDLRLEDLASDAIVFRRAYFFWPGCSELYGDRVVAYRPFRRTSHPSNKWSIFLCVASVIDYMHMPQLYTTGLVRRSYIDKIKAASGARFFMAWHRMPPQPWRWRSTANGTRVSSHLFSGRARHPRAQVFRRPLRRKKIVPTSSIRSIVSNIERTRAWCRKTCGTISI